jgi:hypothetical protein
MKMREKTVNSSINDTTNQLTEKVTSAGRTAQLIFASLSSPLHSTPHFPRFSPAGYVVYQPTGWLADKLTAQLQCVWCELVSFP